MPSITKVALPQHAKNAGSTSRKGKVQFEALAPVLKDRGVPSSSFIMINVSNGSFVTGKTPEEVGQRFELMHTGAEGWMQRVGEVVSDPEGSSPDARSSEADAALPACATKLRTTRRQHVRSFARREPYQIPTRA